MCSSLDAPAGQAPLLSVFGGKITTYRRLAEAALEKLTDFLPAAGRPTWTADVPLPGGDFPVDGYEALVAAILQEHSYLPRRHACAASCAPMARAHVRSCTVRRRMDDLGRTSALG